MAEQKSMTKEECLEILNLLDCERSKADIEECKNMLQTALLQKPAAPSVMSSFLLQMYIALDELIAANRSAKMRGITLIHDGQRNGSVIDMYEAEHELNKLTHALATGAHMKTETGYPDHRARGSVILEGLCHVVLVFNKTCDKFKNLGFTLTDSIFDGHYYKAMGASIRAIELLCHADRGNVEINSILERLEVNDYSYKASNLYHKYSTSITESLKELKDSSDKDVRMFALPVKFGTIRAEESMDKNNPGIVLSFYDKEGKEHASCIMEYYQNKDTILLHVWSPNDPDGDPVYVIDMKNKEKEDAK